MPEIAELRERIEDLEALVAQALEIAAHHGREHIALGRDPYIEDEAQGQAAD